MTLEPEPAPVIDLLQAAAHDLRAPLDGMAALAAEIGREPLSEQARQTLTALQEAIVHLRAVASDILDHGRLSAGLWLGEAQDFDPSALIGSIAAEASARAQASGIDLAVDADRLPSTFTGFPTMIRRLTGNLLDNAFKHGRRVRFDAMVADGDLILRIGDDGPGLPAEFSNRRFRPYARSADAPPGTGLGLAIVQAIVERLEGSMTVASAPGAGTTFEIRLPAHQATAVLAAAAAERTQPMGGRLAVLVVDDNPMGRRFAAALLEALGHEVAEADGPAQALAVFGDQMPDLVLMDLEMADGGGIAALSALRARLGPAHRPPVIATSAHGEAARARAMQAGFDDYLPKPIEARALAAAITSISHALGPR